MEPLLRRAVPADLPEVMALERAGFEAGIVEDEAVFARRIEAFPEGFLLAIQNNAPPWGYFNAEVWSLEPGAPLDSLDPARFDLGHDIGRWLDRAGDTLYLASMTVAPEARGTGAGRRLFRAGLDRMVTDFPGLARAVLIVNEHWTAARRIYSSEGFTEAGRLEGFFVPEAGPVGAAVVMERRV